MTTGAFFFRRSSFEVGDSDGRETSRVGTAEATGGWRAVEPPVATLKSPAFSREEATRGHLGVRPPMRKPVATRTTAIQGWVDAVTEHKSSFPNWPLDDSLLPPHQSSAALAMYDYWWNSIYLHMGALDEPLFYSDPTLSASYGGLGFLVAEKFASAFDLKVCRSQEWLVRCFIASSLTLHTE